MKIQTKDAFFRDKGQEQPQRTNQALDKSVFNIIQAVREKGDKALHAYTKQFDGVSLETFAVTPQEIREAEQTIPEDVKQAIKQAKQNITHFHENQKENSWFLNDDRGNMLGQKVTPLDRVGIYVPGGKAGYPSTVLMNVIPAQLAGVLSISIVTPPQPDGSINPYVLAAANEVGVDAIYKVGGAQAIAALAYGTESISSVSKITGPGNAYVARAKKWVFGDVAIDMVAGPSEVCVVADETADAKLVAADLLAQAEHDEQAQAICITTSPILQAELNAEIDRQLPTLERQSIIQASLNTNGRILTVDNLDDAFEIVNTLAPEHLQLMIKNPEQQLAQIRHAGAIFLGPHSPEPLGDYLAGPNHTLPTSGTATFASPLGVYDFMKKSSLIRYTKQALMEDANTIITLAEAEGLTAHANAIRQRL